MIEQTTSRIITSANLLGAAIITGLSVYAMVNTSGHISFSPYVFLVLFIPLIAAGIVFLAQSRFRIRGLCLACAIVIGVVGVLFLVYLDRTNTLLEYGVWVQRGMPAKGLP